MHLPSYIEVETSRLCNRQCEWCPNHFSEDRAVQKLMDWSIYLSVLRSLSRHQYKGWLCFHNYNEPLANPRLVREVAVAKRLLPMAHFSVYTNGDFLTNELFNALLSVGLTEMRITVYPRSPSTDSPSHAGLWQWLEARPFLKIRGFRQVSVRQGLALVTDCPMSVIIISPDVTRYYDRGGTLPALSIKNRSAPCLLTSRSQSIDHRGDIKMCCNIVTGHQAHRRYFYGNAQEHDPIEVWNSTRYSDIRARHRRADWIDSPICATCRQEIAAK